MNKLDVPFGVATKLMSDQKFERKDNNEGVLVWKKGAIVVSLIETEFISIVVLEDLMRETLEMEGWEIDYWIGENTSFM